VLQLRNIKILFVCKKFGNGTLNDNSEEKNIVVNKFKKIFNFNLKFKTSFLRKVGKTARKSENSGNFFVEKKTLIF